VTFEVITAVLLRLRVFCDMALCCWVRVSKKNNVVFFGGAFETSGSTNVATQLTSQENGAFNSS
jgi:hypothetical protein